LKHSRDGARKRVRRGRILPSYPKASRGNLLACWLMRRHGVRASWATRAEDTSDSSEHEQYTAVRRPPQWDPLDAEDSVCNSPLAAMREPHLPPHNMAAGPQAEDANAEYALGGFIVEVTACLAHGLNPRAPADAVCHPSLRTFGRPSDAVPSQLAQASRAGGWTVQAASSTTISFIVAAGQQQSPGAADGHTTGPSGGGHPHVHQARGAGNCSRQCQCGRIASNRHCRLH